MSSCSYSACMPSDRGARPFLNLLMAAVTSPRDGSSTVVLASGGVVTASSSSIVECVPSEWFSAASKCSLHRSRTSSSELHGELSAFQMEAAPGVLVLPARWLIALNTEPIQLDTRSASTTCMILVRYVSRFSFAFALNIPCSLFLSGVSL